MDFCVSTQVGQPNIKVTNDAKEITKGPVINQLESGLPAPIDSSLRKKWS